jgi:hypothetical protein
MSLYFTIRRLLPALLAAALVVPTVACGADETPATGKRGVAGRKKKDGKKDSRRKGKNAAAGAAGAAGAKPEPEVDPGPKRPPPTLDATSFVRRRDPFQGFVATAPVQPEPDPIRAERKVELRQYSFEDLRLVAIANSRRSGVRPRALFVAGDGFSGSVLQGQHFSTAEVLLVAVNRDYVEIEVVDEELASSLSMERGERRALYLRNE